MKDVIIILSACFCLIKGIDNIFLLKFNTLKRCIVPKIIFFLCQRDFI